MHPGKFWAFFLYLCIYIEGIFAQSDKKEQFRFLADFITFLLEFIFLA